MTLKTAFMTMTRNMATPSSGMPAMNDMAPPAQRSAAKRFKKRFLASSSMSPGPLTFFIELGPVCSSLLAASCELSPLSEVASSDKTDSFVRGRKRAFDEPSARLRALATSSGVEAVSTACVKALSRSRASSLERSCMCVPLSFMGETMTKKTLVAPLPLRRATAFLVTPRAMTGLLASSARQWNMAPPVSASAPSKLSWALMLQTVFKTEPSGSSEKSCSRTASWSLARKSTFMLLMRLEISIFISIA